MAKRPKIKLTGDNTHNESLLGGAKEINFEPENGTPPPEFLAVPEIYDWVRNASPPKRKTANKSKKNSNVTKKLVMQVVSTNVASIALVAAIAVASAGAIFPNLAERVESFFKNADVTLNDLPREQLSVDEFIEKLLTTDDKPNEPDPPPREENSSDQDPPPPPIDSSSQSAVSSEPVSSSEVIPPPESSSIVINSSEASSSLQTSSSSSVAASSSSLSSSEDNRGEEDNDPPANTEHEIKFVHYGNAGYNHDYTIPNDGLVTRPPDPTRNGYSFIDWFTIPNPDLSIPGHHDAVFDFDIPVTADTTLYAAWEINSYNLNYFYGDPSIPNKTENFNVESPTTTLEIPTRTGFRFDGWYTTQSFDAGTEITSVPTGSYDHINIYAKWVGGSSITYVLNGGTNSPSNITSYASGTTTFTFHNPIRVGYNFLGWYTSPTFDTGSEIANITTSTTGNLTLHARWYVVENTVGYSWFDGVNRDGASDYTYTVEDTEAERTLGIDTPPRQSKYLAFSSDLYLQSAGWFIFEGWEEVHQMTFEQTPISILPIPPRDGTIVITATFTPIEYDLIYDANGGTLPTTAYDNTFNYHHVFEPKGDHQGNPAPAAPVLNLPTPTKPNSVFAGWEAWKYGEATGDYTIALDIIPIGEGRMPTGFGDTPADVKLVANWVTGYSINYNLDEVAGEENSIQNPEFYIPGDTFTLYPAAKQGYYFEGWYDDPTGGNLVTTITTNGSDTGVIDLYPRWTAWSFTAFYTWVDMGNEAANSKQYETDNRELSPPPGTMYPFEEQQYLPASKWFTNDGKWYDSLDKLNATEVRELPQLPNPNDIVDIYTFFEVVEHGITYDVNGGQALTGTYDTTYHYYNFDPLYPLTLPTTTQAGLVFNGWTTSYGSFINVGEVHLPTPREDVGGPITLTASWREIRVTYVINPSGDVDYNNPTTLTDPTTLNDPSPDPDARTFVGWFDAETGGDQVTGLDPMDYTSDITLYARWS